MIEPLPVRRTRTFQLGLNTLIARIKRENLLYDLRHITKEDLSRFYNLKGPTLGHYRSYHKGDFRILFIYCYQCIHEFNKPITCIGCDENDLEKLVLMSIDHRSNAYRDNRTEFTLWDE